MLFYSAFARKTFRMTRLTTYFLRLKPLTLFLLSFLGVPLYLWIFSIIYQLDGKLPNGRNKLKMLIAALLTFYASLNVLIYFLALYTPFDIGFFNYFDAMLRIKWTSMLGLFLLRIMATDSYGSYERFIGRKPLNPLLIFFMLWFFIVGIWILQPSLQQYSADGQDPKESKDHGEK